MSDNAVVVGGRVVEQTEAQDTGGQVNENKEAAKEAVKKALGKYKAKSEAPAEDDSASSGREKDVQEDRADSPNGKTRPNKSKEDEGAGDDDSVVDSVHDEKDDKDSGKKAKPKEDGDSEETNEVRKVLAARKKTAQAKQQAMDELAQVRAQVEQSKLELQRQQAEAQRQMQTLQKLRTNPVEAVREFGWDPEDFVMQLAQSGTPEGKQALQLRQLQAQIESQQQFQQNLIQQQRRALEAQQYQQQVMHRQHIENQFLGMAFNEEKHPHIAAFYKGREGALISEGDIIAAQYRELTGQEADISDIVEHIEKELASRGKSWYDTISKKAQQSQQVRDEEELEYVPVVDEVPATGKRVGKTLSPDTAPERRSPPKDYSKLDEEQRLEVAKAEVRKALNKYRPQRDE